MFRPTIYPSLKANPILRQMLKLQWQNHYMAAAYRASEEEWERASSVSGHPGPSRSTSPQFQKAMPSAAMYHQYPQYTVSPQPPLAHGYPASQPQPQFMYPYPGMPSSPYNHPHEIYATPPQSVGYGYGTPYPAQSVYGGEFGPPSFSHPQLQLSGSRYNLSTYGDQNMPIIQNRSADPQRPRGLSSTSQALYDGQQLRSRPAGYNANSMVPSNDGPKSRDVRDTPISTPPRPGHARVRSGGTNTSSPPPPSSWRRSTSGISQLEQGYENVKPIVRPRPTTQYAN